MPTPGPNDLLIRVKHSSICGTDVHIYNWDSWAQKTIPVPMVVGHEYVGVVAAVGAEVRGFAVGDRVSGEGHVTCGHCRNCRAGRRHLCRNTLGVGVNRPGSFAEYLVLPAFNAFKLPDDIPDEIAAIFDPFGNAVHTALSFDLVGEDVLITGAGPIGVMAAAVARHVGARNVVVTDVNDYRLGLARQMGATRAVNVAREDLWAVAQSELGMTEGFDVGMEMSGSGAAFAQMVSVMNHGGKVAILGIPSGRVDIDWNAVIFKMLTLKGIYGREMFETWYKMTALIQSGLDLTPVLTHRFAIDDFQKGFGVMLSGQSGKVILDWEARGEARADGEVERVTARRRILAAFHALTRETGRSTFTLEEIAGRVPEYARGTVSAHLSSFMADGKNHGKGYEEVERVGRSQYRLTAKGRSAQRDLGLLP